MSVDKRYMIRGTGRVHWLTAAPADPMAPTLAEIAAGTDLSCDVHSIGGLDVNHAPVDVSVESSPHGRSIPGRSSAEPISIELYSYNDGTEVARPLLSAGVEGWLVLCPRGLVAGARALTFRVESAGNADVWAVEPRGATYLVPLTKRATYPNGVLS